MTKIKPVGRRAVVQRQDAVATKGGILLPDSAQKKPKQGKVLAVGTGLDIKVGDEVIFTSFGGTEYKMGDDDYLILNEEDILAIVK
jgi:chaperonin GroES